MTNPLASVAMMTYNHAPYVARAIEGVLMQKSHFPFELVIGEDCSTDGTHEIVMEYFRRFPGIIQVITSEDNVGMHANIERILQACRGRYVAWCEGDDHWHCEDKLQKQISYLEAHKDCVLVHSDYDYYEVRTGRRITSYNRYRGMTPPADHKVSDLLRCKFGIRTCTACARLDAVRKIRASDPEMYASKRFLLGDTPLWADILCQYIAYYFDESLATYNVLPESVSRSKSSSLQQRFYKSCAEMRVYIARKHRLPLSELRSYEQELHDSSLFLAFLEQDKELGIRAWSELIERTLRRRLLLWGSQSKTLNGILKAIWLCKRQIRRLLSNSTIITELRLRRNRHIGIDTTFTTRKSGG